MAPRSSFASQDGQDKRLQFCWRGEEGAADKTKTKRSNGTPHGMLAPWNTSCGHGKTPYSFP